MGMKDVCGLKAPAVGRQTASKRQSGRIVHSNHLVLLSRESLSLVSILMLSRPIPYSFQATDTAGSKLYHKIATRSEYTEIDNFKMSCGTM